MSCFSAVSACPKLGYLLLLRNFLFATVWSGSIRNWLHKLDELCPIPSVFYTAWFRSRLSYPHRCLTFILSLWRIQCPRAVSNKTLISIMSCSSLLLKRGRCVVCVCVCFLFRKTEPQCLLFRFFPFAIHTTRAHTPKPKGTHWKD